MRKLKISKDILDALFPLTKLPVDVTEAVVAELQNKLPFRLMLDDNVLKLIEQCDALSGYDAKYKIALADVIAGIHSLIQSVDTSLDDLLQQIKAAYLVDSNFDVDEAALENLQANVALVLRIKQLFVSIKGGTLLNDNDRLYIKAKIVTDVRPIFDDEIAKPVAAAVVLHTLKLTLRRNSSNENIYIALDSIDLADLKKLVERAIEKTEAINKVFASESGNGKMGKLLELDNDD